MAGRSARRAVVSDAGAAGPKEFRIEKTNRDAFQDTELRTVLTRLNATHLVIGGCMTQFSIASTLGRAVAEGNGVVLGAKPAP
ncbi:MAG TPA: isochorismatase family protein [Jatrophihabitans sp.]|nr:isochorismatase family protein [Jatrophihabitans sp.]